MLEYDGRVALYKFLEKHVTFTSSKLYLSFDFNHFYIILILNIKLELCLCKIVLAVFLVYVII